MMVLLGVAQTLESARLRMKYHCLEWLERRRWEEILSEKRERSKP